MDSTSVVGDTVIGLIQKEMDKVPEKVKSAVTSSLPAVSILVKSATDYKDNHECLEQLHTILTTEKTASVSYAEQLVNACKSRLPAIGSESKNIIAAAQCSEVADSTLVQCVEKCMKQSANRALGAGFAISLVGIIFEAGRLYKLWGDISETKLFLKDGFDEKKKLIQERLDKLPADIAKFAEGLEESQFENMSDKQRLRFHVRKSKDRDNLRRSIDSIEDEIGNLTAVVNGKIQTLSSYCDAAIPAATGQVLQGAGLGVNVALFGAAANPVLAAATGVAVLANFCAAGTGLYLKGSAGKTIVELGKKLDEIKQLRNLIVEQQNALDSVFDEFDDKIIGDNE